MGKKQCFLQKIQRPLDLQFIYLSFKPYTLPLNPNHQAAVGRGGGGGGGKDEQSMEQVK